MLGIYHSLQAFPCSMPMLNYAIQPGLGYQSAGVLTIFTTVLNDVNHVGREIAHRIE